MGRAERAPVTGDVRDTADVEAIVLHSGGMDSSLCLASAVRAHGAGRVLSLGFGYGQRHGDELARAERIARRFGVRRHVVEIGCYRRLTRNALMDAGIPIEHAGGEAPNTLVVGRNGLMIRLAAILAGQIGARTLYVGVIGVEAANSGYRDCTRPYIDRLEEILRIDLGDEDFEILTPLVDMSKAETMEFGDRLGCLEFLLDATVTCYEGIPRAGCRKCPACKLRNEGLAAFLDARPDFVSPYDLAAPDPVGA